MEELKLKDKEGRLLYNPQTNYDGPPLVIPKIQQSLPPFNFLVWLRNAWAVVVVKYYQFAPLLFRLW